MFRFTCCVIIFDFCLVGRGSGSAVVSSVADYVRNMESYNNPPLPDCTESVKAQGGAVQFEYLSKGKYQNGFMYPWAWWIHRILSTMKVSVQKKNEEDSIKYCWILEDCGVGIACIKYACDPFLGNKWKDAYLKVRQNKRLHWIHWLVLPFDFTTTYHTLELVHKVPMSRSSFASLGYGKGGLYDPEYHFKIRCLTLHDHFQIHIHVNIHGYNH